MFKKRRFEEIGIKIDAQPKNKKSAPKKTEEKLQKLKLENFKKKNIPKPKQTVEEIIENAPRVPEASLGLLLELLQNLERHSLINSNMRSKYSNNPKKFMQSEIDLSEAIKKMHQISVAPELYERLSQSNFTSTLYSLLCHENTDIAIDIMNLLNDLIDPPVFLESKGPLRFLEKLKIKEIFEMVVKNLSRLTDSEDDSLGLYNALSLFEDLMEIDLQYLIRLLSTSNLLKQLVQNLCQRKVDDSNRRYSAELLAIFANLSPQIIDKLVSLNIFKDIQIVLNKITKIQTISIEETEFLSNLLDLITSIFLTDSKPKTLKKDMMHSILCLIKKKKFKCQLEALNVLSSSVINSKENCDEFINSGGLKIVFKLFLKCDLEKNPDFIEQISIIFVRCFSILDGINYFRFLKKFKENKTEKIDRTVEAFDFFFTKIEETEKKMASDTKNAEFSDKKRFLYRYVKGGFQVALLSTLLGFLLTSGDLAVSKRAQQVLAQYDIDRSDIAKEIGQFRVNMEGGQSAAANRPIEANVLENLARLVCLENDDNIDKNGK